MSVWKIRHRESGLYYKPSGGGTDLNVSKGGRAYTTRPTLRVFAGRTVRLGYGAVGQAHEHHANEPLIVLPFKPREWELVELVTRERVLPWPKETSLGAT